MCHIIHRGAKMRRARHFCPYLRHFVSWPIENDFVGKLRSKSAIKLSFEPNTQLERIKTYWEEGVSCGWDGGTNYQEDLRKTYHSWSHHSLVFVVWVIHRDQGLLCLMIDPLRIWLKIELPKTVNYWMSDLMLFTLKEDFRTEQARSVAN